MKQNFRWLWKGSKVGEHISVRETIEGKLQCLKIFERLWNEWMCNFNSSYFHPSFPSLHPFWMLNSLTFHPLNIFHLLSNLNPAKLHGWGRHVWGQVDPTRISLFSHLLPFSNEEYHFKKSWMGKNWSQYLPPREVFKHGPQKISKKHVILMIVKT